MAAFMDEPFVFRTPQPSTTVAAHFNTTGRFTDVDQQAPSSGAANTVPMQLKGEVRAHPGGSPLCEFDSTPSIARASTDRSPRPTGLVDLPNVRPNHAAALPEPRTDRHFIAAAMISEFVALPTIPSLP